MSSDTAVGGDAAVTDDATVPIVLAIDVEPDPGGGTWREPEPWRGFERWVEYAPQLRRRLGEVSGAPVRLAWFVRVDRQVGEVYGDPAWALDHYRSEFDTLRAAGDEIGIHPHAWRWDGHAGEWVQDHADAAWIDQVLDESLGAFANALGEPARAHRFGSRFISPGIVEAIARHGVRVDTTLEPGAPGMAKLDAHVASTGYLPDQRQVPREPYRPDVADPRRPATSDSRPAAEGLWMLPHSAFDPQPLLPRWRQLARRARFLGQGRHRPAQIWTSQDADGFWELAWEAAQTLRRPYLLIAVRSDALIRPGLARGVTAKLEALERQPMAHRLRFTTASEALDELVSNR